MKNKGQIFTLDLMLAFSLIALSLGLAINYFEVNALAAKEAQNQNELWQAAKTATDIITTNPDFTCDVNSALGGAIIDELPNCLPTSITITQSAMGLSAYKCRIQTVDGTTINFTGSTCRDSLDGTEPNVATIDRQIVVITNALQTTIDKKDLILCRTGGTCILGRTTIRLKVWK